MGEEMLWGVKNGDLLKVQECVKKQVREKDDAIILACSCAKLYLPFVRCVELHKYDIETPSPQALLVLLPL